MVPVPGALPDPSHSSLAAAAPRSTLLLLALCLLVYVPGFFTIPPVDRDESRFVQASRQMFESVALPPARQTPRFHDGGLIIPKIQDRPRLNKPPLIYWLQSASAALCTAGDPSRDAIWMYRIPSLLAAIAAVFLTRHLGAAMFGPRIGLLAAAMLAVCPVVAWEAHQAPPDMVLLAFTTATMAMLWKIWSRATTPSSDPISIESASPAAPDASVPPAPIANPKSKIRNPIFPILLFWLCLCAGVLTKGPITPLIASLTALALCIATRRWRWLLSLRPLLGLLILAAAVAPWVYAVSTRVGSDLYFRTILDETLGRAVKSKEGHWAPPGYHLVLLPILFWPGSLLTAAGVTLAFRQAFPRKTARPDGASPSSQVSNFKSQISDLKSQISDPRSRPDLFLLSWILPSFLFFELVGTKLPHYTMPLYPAIAIVTARAVFYSASALAPSGLSGGAKVGAVIWALIGAVLIGGLTATLGFFLFLFTKFAFEDHAFRSPLPQLILTTSLCAVACVLLVRAALSLVRAKVVRAHVLAIVAWIIAAAVGLETLAPLAAPGAITEEFGREIRAEHDWTHRPIASEYHEDSLIYALRGHVDRIEPGTAKSWILAHPDGIVIALVDWRSKETRWWEHDDQFRSIGSMPWTLLSDAVPIYKAIIRTNQPTSDHQ